jgi:hypothetical protein
MADDWGAGDKPVTQDQSWGGNDKPVAASTPSLWDKVKAFGSGLSTAPLLHPIDTAKSMFGMAAHPVDTLDSMEKSREETVDRATDEFHKGNYSGAAIHAALSLIPQIGPQLSENYKEIRDAQDAGDDVAEAKAAGKMIGLAGSVEAARNLPAAAKGIKTVAEATPHIVEAVSDSGAAGDMAKGTAKAAAGGTVAAAAHAVGLGPLGEYLFAKDLLKSGAKDVGTGIQKAYGAFKEGIQNYQEANAPAPEPTQRTPIWQTAQAMQPPPAAEAVPASSPAASAPTMPPTLAARLAARAAEKAATPPTAGPVEMPQPQAQDFSWPGTAAGPEPPSGPSLVMPRMQSSVEGLDTSKIQIQDADDLAAEKIKLLTQKPDASGLKDTMRDLPPSMRKAAADANYRALKEGAPGADAGEAYKTAAQINKAQRLAQSLRDANISHDDLIQMKPVDLQKQLGDAAKALGINKTGTVSLDSVAQTLFELKKLETAAAR